MYRIVKQDIFYIPEYKAYGEWRRFPDEQDMFARMFSTAQAAEDFIKGHKDRMKHLEPRVIKTFN